MTKLHRDLIRWGKEKIDDWKFTDRESVEDFITEYLLPDDYDGYYTRYGHVLSKYAIDKLVDELV